MRRASFAVFTFVSVLAFVCVLATAHTAKSEVLASFKPSTFDPSFQVNLSSYRGYVKAQLDALVGMTRVLAREVEDGDLDSAQSSYAPTHRFLKHVEAISLMLPELHKRIDARADAYRAKEADPSFGGFHRVEYGLFAKRSTSDLFAYADRLDKDARELRERIASVPITSATMVDGIFQLVRELADEKLTGAEERFSRTDLWDLEANIDGVQRVLALLQPSLEAQHADIFARTKVHFAHFDELLAKQKEGCGFKNYDEVSKDDKAALRASVLALAGDLSTLKGAMTVD